MVLVPLGPGPKKTTAQKPRVLYVEDEDANWDVAEVTLADKYEVTRAKTSREAISKLTTQTFAIILMDIQLMGSDMNGIEITQVLRGKTPAKAPPRYCDGFKPLDTPVIFVTAYNARYSLEELLQVGGNDLISKPVDFTKLTLSMARVTIRKIGGKSGHD